MSVTTLPRPQIDDAPGMGGGGSLLAQFREFHAELTGIREALALGDRMAGSGQALPDPADVAARINRRLHRLLDAQAAQAARTGGRVGAELYREAQYLMVALADEVLLHRESWSGRDHWMDHLLELSLFGTRVAGERVFQKLDALLASRTPPDPDLLSIHLAVLSLGFRGRFFRPQDDPQLRRYRTSLAQLLSQSAGRVRGEQEFRRLCPDAYAATVTEGRTVLLPHLRPWIAGFAAVLAVYTLVAHGVWHVRTERIRALTEQSLPDLFQDRIRTSQPAGGRP